MNALESYVQFDLNSSRILAAKYREIISSVIVETRDLEDIKELAKEVTDMYVELRFSVVPLMEEDNRAFGNPYLIYSKRIFQSMVAHKPTGLVKLFFQV